MKLEEQLNNNENTKHIVNNVYTVCGNSIVKVKGTQPILVKDFDLDEEVEKNPTDNLEGTAAGVEVMSAETSVIMDKNIFDFVVFISYLSNKHIENKESVSLLKSSTNNNKLDAKEIDSCHASREETHGEDPLR